MPTLVKNDDTCEIQLVHPKAVAKAKAGLPKTKDVLIASELLKAIADPTRMKILAALRAASELCVCDIAAVVEMSESAVSHQLRLLRDVNLVTSRKEGRQVFYQLSDDHVSSICILRKQRVAQRLSAEMASSRSAHAAFKLGLCCQILRRSSPDKQIRTKTSTQPGGC